MYGSDVILEHGNVVANGGLVHQISDERGAAPSRISVLGDYSDVLADITIKQTVLKANSGSNVFPVP